MVFKRVRNFRRRRQREVPDAAWRRLRRQSRQRGRQRASLEPDDRHAAPPVYRVSYWVGNYGGNGNSPAIIGVTITDGSSNTIFLGEGQADATTEPSTWRNVTFSFIGDGTSNTITFGETGSLTYVGLDDVSVAAIPEPSAWALAFVGFAGLGLAGTRSGQKIGGGVTPLGFGLFDKIDYKPMPRAAYPEVAVTLSWAGESAEARRAARPPEGRRRSDRRSRCSSGPRQCRAAPPRCRRARS